MALRRPNFDWNDRGILVVTLAASVTTTCLAPRLYRSSPVWGLLDVAALGLLWAGAALAGSRGVRDGFMVYGALGAAPFAFIMSGRCNITISLIHELFNVAIFVLLVALTCRAASAIGRFVRLFNDGKPVDPHKCADCGYDLRGLIDRRCPECGLAFQHDPPALGAP